MPDMTPEKVSEKTSSKTKKSDGKSKTESASQVLDTTKVSEPVTKVSETATKVSKTVKVSEPASKVSEPVKPVETTLMASETTTETTVTLQTTETVEESNTEILFNKLVNQFQDIQLVMKTLHFNLKVLQKEVLRERKESKKKESKIKKKSDKKKSPSGFAKPTPIKSELADFLGLAHDVQIARTEVTTKVIAYVKEHGLQNPENKKQIVPDAKLGALLQAGTDVVTFFNLQTYLKKHFISATTPVVTPSVTQSVV